MNKSNESLTSTIGRFVVTHKDVKKRKSYTYIAVGKNLENDKSYVHDNTFENISSKNSNYCELTALYWIWKNDKSSIISLEHYRRFFTLKENSVELKNEDIVNILNDFDVIVPQHLIFKGRFSKVSNYKNFKVCHPIESLDLTLDVLLKKHPSFSKSVKRFLKSNKLMPFNMFIMKRELLNEYCSWLFDILFEVESKLDISSYDTYQARVFGFLSERLFNIWLIEKELKLYNMNVLFIDE